MSHPSPANPLVAIGGLGGSGTRVFAATLRAAGIRIGSCLNDPLDNLWFTVLFKRAEWCRLLPSAQEVSEAADLFRRAMTTGLRGTLNPEQIALLTRLRNDLPPGGSWHCGASAADADALMGSAAPGADPDQPWGWKEPNTHVFLSHLARCYPGFRYIHVVRDGLDMAFSRNTWQAQHWSHLYGLERTPDTPLPLHQLRYWVLANRAALDLGAVQMRGRFLVVSYEAYCANPEQYWPRLRRFLDLPRTTALPDNLLQPTTIGRSQHHDLSVFPPDLLAAVLEMQAEVARLSTPD